MSKSKNTVKAQWQQCRLHVKTSEMIVESLPAWQLTLQGRVVLTAISPDPLADAISPEDRNLIGQALVEYVSRGGK